MKIQQKRQSINIKVGFILAMSMFLNISIAETLIEPGVWSVTISQQINGIPKSEPVTYQQCFESLKNLAKILKPEPNCSVYNILVKAKKISWDIHCVSSTNSSDGNAKLLKSNGKLSGKIEMRVAIPGVSFTMPTVREINATRISDCTP